MRPEREAHDPEVLVAADGRQPEDRRVQRRQGPEAEQHASVASRPRPAAGGAGRGARPPALPRSTSSGRPQASAGETAVPNGWLSPRYDGQGRAESVEDVAGQLRGVVERDERVRRVPPAEVPDHPEPGGNGRNEGPRPALRTERDRDRRSRDERNPRVREEKSAISRRLRRCRPCGSADRGREGPRCRMRPSRTRSADRGRGGRPRWVPGRGWGGSPASGEPGAHPRPDVDEEQADAESGTGHGDDLEWHG